MQPNDREIIILKPTKVFLAFLASQIPEIQLPTLKELQTDCTAYSILRQEDDEATLNEIERHFTSMFRHEIRRWLGENAHNEVEASFLDFLCCFKFEMHSHIFLLEEDLIDVKQLIRVQPRSVLLKWMRSAVEDNAELVAVLQEVNLAQLAENATVVAKNFSNMAEIKPFMFQYYHSIFEAEMLRMCDSKEQWPNIDSFDEFNRYFSINVHTQLLHLN